MKEDKVNEDRKKKLLDLPYDIILQIIKLLPRHDIFFGVAHVNAPLRGLVQGELRSFKLFDAHCHVYITDTVAASQYRNDGTDSMITYTFTIFDRLLPDYEQKRRLCLRGNDQRYRELHISHKYDSKMNAQFDSAGFNMNVSSTVAYTMLSYMNICAMRCIVQKSCRAESLRKEDDYFLDCLNFCEKRCGKVNLKALLLSSKSVLFPWKMSSKSLKKLSSLPLRSLILENMMAMDSTTLANCIPIRYLASLQFRLDPRHRMEIDELTLSQIDGNVLKSISKASVPFLDFSAYSDISSLVSSIDPITMCHFISNWRSSKKPWMIRSVSFNSTVTIDEFRSTAYAKFTSNELEDVPYCRFQTCHKKYQNVALQLACYANGNATQWLLRAGYSNPPN